MLTVWSYREFIRFTMIKVGLGHTVFFKTAKKNLQMKNMQFSEKNYQLYTLAASDPGRSKSKRKDPSKTLFMKR